MSLPVKSLPTGTVTIDGADVPVRGLSRTEAMKFTTGFTPDAMPGISLNDRADAAEVFLLIHGAGVDEAEAVQWRATTDADTVGMVVDKVMELSGLIKAEGAPDPQPAGSAAS